MSITSRARNTKQPNPNGKAGVVTKKVLTKYPKFSMTEFIVGMHETSKRALPRDTSMRGPANRRRLTKGAGVMKARGRVTKRDKAKAATKKLKAIAQSLSPAPTQ